MEQPLCPISEFAGPEGPASIRPDLPFQAGSELRLAHWARASLAASLAFWSCFSVSCAIGGMDSRMQPGRGQRLRPSKVLLQSKSPTSKSPALLAAFEPHTPTNAREMPTETDWVLGWLLGYERSPIGEKLAYV